MKAFNSIILYLLNIGILLTLANSCKNNTASSDISILREGFNNPPNSARPGVYWYFMDGNLSKEGMTKDLESMKEVGIGHVLFLEVNIGVPRGKVDFLSEEWKQLFKHALEETERLGIEMTLGIGPGWTGSGGPWVKPEESMQHLVSSSIEVSKEGKQRMQLPVPQPKRPYFGEGTLIPELKEKWNDYYQDIAILAFPTPKGNDKIADTDEKALYYRAPYSSVPGVKQYLPMYASYDEPPVDAVVDKTKIIDLTANLNDDGTLDWDVPEGKWTIMRFGSRNNGAVTRPAPHPGLGFEADKFDTVALNAHLDRFIGNLFRTIGFTGNKKDVQGGLKMLHIDSWEMGAQNWTQDFRTEFIKRRGYDPKPFYPVYAGVIVQSREISERFLWDLRKTSQELILENHAGHIHKYAHSYGLGLSIEPYDMNPSADLELGAIADFPMCEFWTVNYGYYTVYSAAEGTSLAHIKGQPVVPAESFTTQYDGWDVYPGMIKNQNDWAFAAGINRFMFHTFQHQPLDDNLKPGMTMGVHGVHWDRNQTWWPMADGYLGYVAKSQYLLQQGRTVADILYLCPEGSPHVFQPPASALDLDKMQLPDRRGYSFDACPPSLFYQASVKNNQVIFPSGACYKILVLPAFETITPELLKKIQSLVNEGATVVGLPPKKSPSLVNYPQCDEEVKKLSNEIWGSETLPANLTTRNVGKGKVIWGKEIAENIDNLYPHYNVTSAILASMGLMEDFRSNDSIRYTHRTAENYDIYFVGNRTSKTLTTDCWFRVTGKTPELWDAMTGEIRPLPEYEISENQTKITLQFDSHQAYFIVFHKDAKSSKGKNFIAKEKIATLDKPWTVKFDPKWGGPAEIIFDKLSDWSNNADEGIKYYSGIATYEQTFDMPSTSDNRKTYLNLGNVGKMARIWLNGKDLGVVWTEPWQMEITNNVKDKDNELKIEVANLWINRLIGDDFLPNDWPKDGKWPEWFLNGEERTSGRYTFTTYSIYSKDSKLSESGLLGPVTLWQEKSE